MLDTRGASEGEAKEQEQQASRSCRITLRATTQPPVLAYLSAECAVVLERLDPSHGMIRLGLVHM